MKKLATLCLAACLAAAPVTPTGILDYAIDAPEGLDYGKPTSVEVVRTVDSGVLKSEDISKNAVLILLGFGSASVDTLNTRTQPTPNLAPEGMAVGVINGSGMLVVFLPSVDTFTVVPTEPEQGTEPGGTLDYTPVALNLYYSGGYPGTLKIPAVGLSMRVYEDTDSSTPMRGVRYFKGTSIWDGNCVIAGYNRGVRGDLRDLHTLEQGDTITWTTKLGIHIYEVTSVQKVKEMDTSGIAPPNKNKLILYTCMRNQRAYRWRVQTVEVVQPTLFCGLIFSTGPPPCYRPFPRFPVCCCYKEYKDSRGKKEANRMKRKQLIPVVLTGTLIGAVLVRFASAGVAALTTAPSTQTFYTDGKQVDPEVYVINGHNYMQLRDAGRAVDFGAVYDQGANRVLTDTSSPYVEESTVSAPSGVVTVPQSGEPLRLREGDKVPCDDGTTYEITDPRLWEESEPLPAYDQTRLPELELLRAEVCRFQNGYGNNLHIRNLHET